MQAAQEAGPGGGGQAVAAAASADSAGGEGNERFRLEFYVQGFNVLNRTNFVNFSGNLQSPFFGTSHFRRAGTTGRSGHAI